LSNLTFYVIGGNFKANVISLIQKFIILSQESTIISINIVEFK